MSTDAQAPERTSPSRRRRPFAIVALAVVGALVAASVLTAGAVFAQGPRVTDVLSDPEGATTTSGSRVIFTANQPVAPVTPDQVTVEPDAPFTVDTSGRSVGVRFTDPLADGVEYTVTIRDVTGVSRGTPSVFETSFRTPPLHAYLLERSGDTTGNDRIYRTTLDGSVTEEVFAHPHIEDFRESPRGVVVSTLDAENQSELTLVPADGSAPVPLTLPGRGRLFHLQVSDSGDRVGYTWTADPVPDSVVFLSSIATPAKAPVQLDLGNEDPKIKDFRFVPGTQALLLINSSETVLLADPVTGGEPTILGRGRLIDGIGVSPPVAYIRTQEGPVALDLQTGDRTALAADDAEYGQPFAAERIPGRGVLSTYLAFGAGGGIARQSVVLTADDGSTSLVADVAPTDAVVQVCTAPSGRYVAIAVAPTIGTNTIDDYLLAMPTDMVTRVVPLDGGRTVELPGFAISWCRSPAG